MESSDHDLLVRIDERVKKLDRCMTNHLAHHWALTLAIGTAAIGAFVSLIVAVYH